MTNLNMCACRIFGYVKKELLGLKINKLMPAMFSQHHDTFLNTNLLENKINSNFDLNEISAFGLHKNKYIFPMKIKVISIPNILNQMQYLAKITIDKREISSDIGYILIDPKKKHITAINSGTFLFLLNFSLYDFD
jgi:PAS domain S-box-containing protein